MIKKVAVLIIGIAWTPAFAQAPWPGQAGEPVGWQSYGCPGGQLTPYTGGDITVGGTAQNPLTFTCVDFQQGINIFAPHVKFQGSRFQANWDNNVYLDGASGVDDITFYRSSFTPLVTVAPTPPNGGGYRTWPSAGAGQNIVPEDLNGNASPQWSSLLIAHSAGYQYAINDFSSGKLVVDHVDIWGFANAITFYDPGEGKTCTTYGPKTVVDTWIHDNRHPGVQPDDDHTDGPGYLTGGGTDPCNVTVQHSTIALGGNTNAIADQGGSVAGGSNWRILNNFLSGFDYTVIIAADCPPGTGIMVTNNTFSTVFPWLFGTILPGLNGNFGGTTGNVWSGNKLSIWPGTSATPNQDVPWTTNMDGWYVWPDETYNQTDFH